MLSLHRHLFFWVIALAILVSSGCAHRRPLVFGLYNVPRDSLAEVKKSGFDVVTAENESSLSDYLAQARANDVQVLLPSGAFAGDKNRSQRLLEAHDRHPATWGWYLIDEPDLNDVPPQRVAEVTRSFQRRARKPGVVVLASGNAVPLYGSDCDLLMVDFYPVPWAPVSRFAREMRLASFARGDKPFMAVVQAFDWTHFSDVLGQTNDLRAPTIAEIRCMSYMALAMGARGLFYYTYQARTWHLPDSPLWPELKSLIAEMKSVAPLFDEPPLWFPTEIEYHDPSRMYNEVHDGAILTRLYHLRKPANGMAAGYYFVFLNTTGEEVGYDFQLPFAPVPNIRRGQEFVPVEDGWLKYNFAPYEVSIFGPVQNTQLRSSE